MPASTRSAVVDLSVTPYYHCMARCVRRAFLCGKDPLSGENFDHRKRWFLERLQLAGETFAIDVCAFAIMSNHFHVVLRVNIDRATNWSDEAVLRRYAKFFPRVAREVRRLPDRVRRDRIKVLRQRLTSISWFMRVLNEFIARKANKEDGCRGHFWEGRFRSQPLLDEAALYTCMSYVDLNPIRAGVCSSLGDAEFTSIKQRLDDRSSQPLTQEEKAGRVGLAPLGGQSRRAGVPPLDLRFDDYVALLEWTGRAIGTKPGGRLRGAPPEIVATLGVESHEWVTVMRGDALMRMTAVGAATAMTVEASRRRTRWVKGSQLARRLFRADR